MALLIWLASLGGTVTVGGGIVKGAAKVLNSQPFVYGLAALFGLGLVLTIAECVFNPAFLQVFMTN